MDPRLSQVQASSLTRLSTYMKGPKDKDRDKEKDKEKDRDKEKDKDKEKEKEGSYVKEKNKEKKQKESKDKEVKERDWKERDLKERDKRPSSSHALILVNSPPQEKYSNSLTIPLSSPLSLASFAENKPQYTFLAEENGVKKKFVLGLNNLEELVEHLRKTFVIEGQFELLYFDDQFKEYVKLEKLSQLVNMEGKIKWRMISVEESFEALEAICKKMQDPESGVPVKSKMWRIKPYYRVFSGNSAVKWFQRELKLSFPKAIALGQKLMDNRFIVHVNHARKKFYDDKILYRFQDLGEGSFTPQTSINHDELALKLLDPRHGIKLKDIKIFFKKYKNTFSGSDAVDWLCLKLGIRRNIAIIIGEKLLNEGYFHSCSGNVFADEEEYHFTAENTKKNTNLDFPVERVVHVLQKLKSEDAFRDITEDVDFVINVLASGSKSLYGPNVPDISEDPQMDRDVKSFILYHIGHNETERTEDHKAKEDPAIYNDTNAGNFSLAGSEELINELNQTINNWNFNIFQVAEKTQGKPMLDIAFAVFRKHDLFAKFSISKSKFKNFVQKLEAGYQSNPYHNAIHAADVTQTLNFFITSGGLSEYLTDLDILSALMAALVHDYDHPGKNNSFLINTASPIAILYNDKSVLENHHLAASFLLLKEEDCNIFEHLSLGQYKEIRETMIDMVLATDFSQHFDILGQYKSRSAVGGVKQDRRLLLKMALKCADISHTSKSLDIHQQWTSRITEEFFRQGDEEKKKSLSISPFMDRETTNVAQSQISFLSFLVLPLYQAWVENFPSAEIAHTHLQSNLNYWKLHINDPKYVAPSPNPT
eukprot:TRINITY_DN3408_c0_g1_i1.p1 TRINITY_DN3408_c0_g1~~TRINITY_DN3408_c0_g1_i1.p1  ORF type:complete len:821 (-),score=168.38 TRINITY_DN3408_c0_g1_i1:216-2678(-)